VVATYSGLSVAELSNLRKEMREKKSKMKIVKNNIFKIALKESARHSGVAAQMDSVLKGPVAVVFTDTNLPSVSKTLVEYSKKSDKVQIRGGYMDGRFLNSKEVIQIAELPSREELLSIIARGINTPAQKIAYGINEVMSSLARAIKAVGEKNG
jgi:large subunit ribosomal protein L10